MTVICALLAHQSIHKKDASSVAISVYNAALHFQPIKVVQQFCRCEILTSLRAFIILRLSYYYANRPGIS